MTLLPGQDQEKAEESLHPATPTTFPEPPIADAASYAERNYPPRQSGASFYDRLWLFRGPTGVAVSLNAFSLRPACMKLTTLYAGGLRPSATHGHW
jgi:hypothetical protein